MEKCTECGEMLPFRIDDGEIMPCPSCDSTCHTEVDIKEKIRFTAKPYGTTGRKELEITLGDDFNRTEKKWKKIKRVIDRGNDYYEERVVDPMTGETVCSNQEALSSHIGHGYDKKEHEKRAEVNPSLFLLLLQFAEAGPWFWRYKLCHR